METIYTLKKAVVFKGTGVHTGKAVEVIIVPSDEGKIVFFREDLGDMVFLPEEFSLGSEGSTVLEKNGRQVRTVEHLLATLFCLRIFSCSIHLNGDEVPILDGSAFPVADLIRKSGRIPLKNQIQTLRIIKPFSIVENNAGVRVEPCSNLKISYLIDFAHPSIGRQELSLKVDESSFLFDIAPARTFGFLKDLECLKQKGLAGGSNLKNTIALNEDGIINPPLRFPDEFVRHKILDFIGDLALISHPLKGHFQGIRAGHRFHISTVDFILKHPDYWIWE